MLIDKGQRAGLFHSFNTCCHYRNAHHAFQLFIKGRTKDNNRILIDFTADTISGLIYFKQGHIHAASDINKDRFRPLHRGIIQQWIIDSRFGSFNSTGLARGFARSHHGFTHFRHNRPNIGKIQIDKTRLNHQIGYPAHALMQNRIGHVKRIGKRGTLVCQPEQILIRDNDERIYIGLQSLNTFISLFHTALAFKIKRFGDNANG